MGSVFSPTYRRARARETQPDPMRFCALNVAVYGHDRKRWAFTEHPQARVERAADRFVLGRSHLAWEGDTLVIHIDERSAGLGVPLRGTVRLHPRRCFDHVVTLDHRGRHRWCPVAPLSEIEVDLRQPSLSFTGSGYHDTNFGPEPLEDGFTTWDWSRAELSEGAAMLYDARPTEGEARTQGLLYRPDGSIEPLTAPECYPLARTGWGVDRATRADAGATPTVQRTLENTPFYARSLVQTTLRGQPVTAVHESLDLERFVRTSVQLMIPFRMRRGWRA